jgi:hypothetical protein
LRPAAGNSTEISPQTIISTIFGIGETIAGGCGGRESHRRRGDGHRASYIIAMIPSAVPDLTGPSFSGTFSDLQNRLRRRSATPTTAQSEQSLEVRQNWGLLRLVGQLTGPTGAWHHDRLDRDQERH